MINTFQILYEECQKQTGDESAGSLVLFKRWLNKGIEKAYAELDSEYFYTTATDATVASQSSYPRLYNDARIHSIKVTISSTDYVVVEFPGSENQWIALTGGTSATESSYPTYFFTKRNTYEFYPTPSTSDYTITLRIKRATKALSVANFTTETIKTATSGSTAVVGNVGTLWTTAMGGRFLKITSDGFWYEISSVSDAVNLVLAREFGGTSIAAGTEAYIIGEASLLPMPFQDAPLDYAFHRYYLHKKEFDLAREYKNLFKEKLLEIKSYGGTDTTGLVIEEDIIVPYTPDFPTGLA